jgi:DNA-binding SARP family transcriptional activator/predicted ATPase
MTTKTADGSQLTFRVHFLGQPQMQVGGEQWRFAARPKAMALLAQLLLHSDKPFTRGSLAFALWPDASEDESRANLRRHLHLLQRTLPPPPEDRGWILSDATTVRWNPDAPVWVDAVEFERLAAIPERRAEAVDLYGGDLLATLYEDWIVADRERLAKLFVDSLLLLAREARSDRDFEAASRHAARALVQDPWREDAVRDLMSALYERGDRSGALRAFDDFAAKLRSEMDVEPMPESVALRALILRHAPLSTRGAHADTAPELAHRDRPAAMSFVGRRTEMTDLTSYWARAARGRGGLVLVSGEAGVGKSRLCDQLALLAEAQGGRVLRGATSAPESGPYQSVIEALRSAASLFISSDLDSLWLSAIAELIPELRGSREGLHPPPEMDEAGKQSRLVEAIAQCVAAAAAPRPVLMILEDLHWAGHATMAVTAFLASRLVQMPVLVVATYREEEAARNHPLPAMRRALQRRHLLSHVSLGRMHREDVGELVSAISALGANAEEIADNIFSRSEGNALFVCELIRERLESRMGAEAESDVPAGIRSTILARISRLSPHTRAVLDVAAVAGRTFSIEIPRDVLGWAEADVQRELDELIDRHIVRIAGGFDYAFAHQLIQGTVYDAIAAVDRRRCHKRIGEVLETLAGDSLLEFAADLARHFDEGDEPLRAVRYYETAAEHAASIYAYEESGALAGQGLELTTDPLQRYRLLRLHEIALVKRGGHEGRATDLNELEALALDIGDSKQIFYVLTRRIDSARNAGNHEAAWSAINRLRSEATKAGDLAYIGAASRAAGGLYRLTAELDKAAAEVAAARALAQEAGDQAAVIDCLCDDAVIAIESGDVERSRASLATARRLAEDGHDRARLAAVLHTGASVHNFSGSSHEALELANESLAILREIGDRAREGPTYAMIGATHIGHAEYDEGRQALEESIRINEQFGQMGMAATARIILGMLEGELGLHERGIGFVRRALADLEEVHDYLGVAIATANLCDLYHHMGDFRVARDIALNALSDPRLTRVPRHKALLEANAGMAERELGELKAAIAHLESADASFHETEDISSRCFCLAELAAAYLKAGKAKKARPKVDEYVRDAEKVLIYGPAQQQYGFWVAAQVYRALGDGPRAYDLLQRAHMKLQKMLEQRPAGDARSAFQALAYNREIVAAFDSSTWKPAKS